MRPARSLSRLFRWLGFAAFAQVLCAYDTRSQVRDLWLMLPEASAEADPTQRPTRLSQCGSGRLPAMDLLLPSEPRWDKPIATIAQLESLAGRSLWRSDPIRSPDDFQRSDGTFAHVDPRFVRWARTTLLPGSGDSAFRKATASRYQSCLAPAARALWAVRADLRAAPTCKARLLERYRALNAEGAWDTTSVLSGLFTECIDLSPEALQDSLERRQAMVDLESGGIYLDHGHYTYLLAWWLRRELDGSAGELELGLKALLRAYDAPWLAAHGQPDFAVDPAAAHTAYAEARAARGSLGGTEATNAAVARLREAAGAVQRAALEKRADAIVAVCQAYYAELGPRKAKIYALMEAGDEEAVQVAVREVDAWSSAQQADDQPLGRALADAQVLAEDAFRLDGEGVITEADAVGVVQRVAGGCGR